MKIGDLVKIKSNSGDDVNKVYGHGIYLGIKTTWKDWHQVFVIHPKHMQHRHKQPTNFDDFWELEVVSKIKQKKC